MKKLSGGSAYIVAALSMSLTIVACGKGGDSAKTQSQQEQNVQKSSEEAKNALAPTASLTELAEASGAEAPQDVFKLTSSYLGTNLTMIYPHSRDWGYISLRDDDAKALFNALAVKKRKSEGNLVWLPAIQRQGYNVICFDQARKATPNKHEFACSLYLNYRAGAVSLQANDLQFDNKVRALKNSYIGKDLVMVAAHPAHFSVINIKGDDARALYFTLGVDPVQSEGNLAWGPANVKKGHDLSCYEQFRREAPDQKTYSCSVYINSRTGAVIPPSAN